MTDQSFHNRHVQSVRILVCTRCITASDMHFQVSQVYQTIEFSRLAALAPFVSQFHIERIVVNAAKNLDLQVRIDHRNRMLSFGTDLGVAQKEDCPEVRKIKRANLFIKLVTFSVKRTFINEIIVVNWFEWDNWKCAFVAPNSKCCIRQVHLY